ncbi:MAG: N-acetylmuramoyl-L-alanine amidase [Lachnospiraceae bacterium]|nr:N-acetylmuramoyl-L-alanine amidase [Lachnospiraceae bacterium]
MNIKRYLVFSGILFFCLLFAPALNIRAASRLQECGDEIIIVIDPGHGGDNEGTIENGFLEKEMTLKTAISLVDELSKYDGVTVYLTRDDDTALSLADRAAFAASVHADFLFSIHYNASVSHRLYGSEVWISAFAPYHAYGYQFGCVQLQTMQDMGLFLRGVKTKLNDRGSDYYGIIRECTELEIPSAIIEHCHVDEPRESILCDGDDELLAFGIADATAIAKYLGLKSETLQVDYSDYALADVAAGDLVYQTINAKTDPEACSVSIVSADLSAQTITLRISGSDADDYLMYYDYSFDGGQTFSDLCDWPGCDVFTGSCDPSFDVTLPVPEGCEPQIIVRAYNHFDACCESPLLSSGISYLSEEETVPEAETAIAIEDDLLPDPAVSPSDDHAAKDAISIGAFRLSFRGLVISWCIALGVVLLLLLCNLRRK